MQALNSRSIVVNISSELKNILEGDNNYKHIYDAKDKCILVEYNSYLKIDNLYGIEFINKYLEYINYENIF